MSDRDEQAARNRASFPAASAVLDQFRDIFGPQVVITHVSENGRTAGRSAEDRLPGRWVDLGDIIIQKKKQENSR